jgi:hypothetical protein
LIGYVRKRVKWVLPRWRTLALLAVISVLAPGMKEHVFRARETARDPSQVATVPISHPTARLVQLPAGNRLEGDIPPAGWSHLVIKSLPRLATGDLDTVSSQAFETAQRIRLAIVADVRRSPSGPISFYLERVGVGLCAPAQDGLGDVVVTPTSVEGSQGPWMAKQRIVLAATSLDLSRVRLTAATPTFAQIRTPVMFLVSGSHRKIDVCYALVVNSQNGALGTLAWSEAPHANSQRPSVAAVRVLSSPVFDCPIDIQAKRVWGNIPVSWSFAVRDLPPGTPVAVSPDLISFLASAANDSSRSAQVEQAFVGLLNEVR